MSRWNHRMCGDCWILEQYDSFEGKKLAEKHGVMRAPVIVTDSKPGVCCFCRNPTRIGLFVRRDPSRMECKHEERPE